MACTWWMWSAWIERQGQVSFVYGCLAESERVAGWANRKSVDLDDGSRLVLSQRVIDDSAALCILQELEKGTIDLSPILGLPMRDLSVTTERRIIHDALGHSAARINAYCSPVDQAELAGKTSTWRQILSALERELGLPFTKDYATHIGNFEIIRLQSWLESAPPLVIEAIDSSGSRDERRSVRSLQICRSEDFARATNIAHIVGYGEGERVLDRIVSLPAGASRSALIESPEAIDRYELSLFDGTGETLVHRESQSFLTEINLVMSVTGRRIRIEDRLSRAAEHASGLGAEHAAQVEALSSQRSQISLKDIALRREHAAAMRAVAHACFPPKSEDRWFRRTLDDEVGVIRHFDTLLHGGAVKAAVLVDPFFGVDALERLIMRLRSTDIALTIVMSWARTDPDTGRALQHQTSPEKRLRSVLEGMAPFINPRLRVMNLVAGNDQAFHDRYLLLYPHDGTTKVFLLSNSVNKMAGNWPFCMARLSDDVAHEAQDYIEALCRGEDITGSTNPRISFAWPTEA